MINTSWARNATESTAYVQSLHLSRSQALWRSGNEICLRVTRNDHLTSILYIWFVYSFRDPVCSTFSANYFFGIFFFKLNRSAKAHANTDVDQVAFAFLKWELCQQLAAANLCFAVSGCGMTPIILVCIGFRTKLITNKVVNLHGLISWQGGWSVLHMHSWCTPSVVKGGKGVFNSAIWAC